MPVPAAEVAVTRWQSWTMLVVALAVIGHSTVVGLWLSPTSPIRDKVGGQNLASYVNPYFRQSPTAIDPGLQRADEALAVRAEVRTADGELVVTDWIDITAQQLGAAGFLSTRMDRSARSLATNLNVAMTAMPPEARLLLEEDLTDDDRAVRQVAVEAEGATPYVAQTFFANWAMATQFGTLYASAVADGTVERVQVKVGLRRVPPYDDRVQQKLQDIEFDWVTLGWRAAIAGNQEAQQSFNEYTGQG